MSFQELGLRNGACSARRNDRGHMKLTGRTVLITGGTSGIGFELAKQLLQRGNTVLITGRDQDRLDAAPRTLPALHVFRSDVSDPAQIPALCQSVIAQFPALDVLVNNAGIMRNLKLNQPRSLEDMTREIDINLRGPLWMVQEFLPHLRTRNEAMLVNVTSGLAFVPFPPSPVYSAAKAGLHAFTQVLRVQLAGTAVSVVELAPPGTETPLFRDEFTDELRGQKGMAVDQLVARAITGMEKGKLEIRPGLSNVLKLMSRLAPAFMLKQMTRMSTPKPARA